VSVFICNACGDRVDTNTDGQPCLNYKKAFICANCVIGMIEPIYNLSGHGGIQHIIFKILLESRINRKQRRQIANHKKGFLRSCSININSAAFLVERKTKSVCK